MTISLFTKKGAPSVAFKELYRAAKNGTYTATRFPICVLFLKTVGGRGRYTRLNDAAYYTGAMLLEQLGIKFEEGNAAPRGGAYGDYLLFNAGAFFDKVAKELKARNLTETAMRI